MRAEEVLELRVSDLEAGVTRIKRKDSICSGGRLTEESGALCRIRLLTKDLLMTVGIHEIVPRESQVLAPIAGRSKTITLHKKG